MTIDYDDDKVDWGIGEILLDDGWIIGIDAEDKDHIGFRIWKPIGKKIKGIQKMEMLVEFYMYDHTTRAIIKAILSNMELAPHDY